MIHKLLNLIFYWSILNISKSLKTLETEFSLLLSISTKIANGIETGASMTFTWSLNDVFDLLINSQAHFGKHFSTIILRRVVASSGLRGAKFEF